MILLPVACFGRIKSIKATRLTTLHGRWRSISTRCSSPEPAVTPRAQTEKCLSAHIMPGLEYCSGKSNVPESLRPRLCRDPEVFLYEGQVTVEKHSRQVSIRPKE